MNAFKNEAIQKSRTLPQNSQMAVSDLNVSNIFFLVLFQTFFNILYEEKVDCKLKQSALVEDRMLNWNRINAVICFNYLQQEFYLVGPTMKALAGGKNQTAILKLLRVLISTCQGNYGD